MPTEQSICERLEKLERQNRRMKQIGIVAVIIAASVLLMGQKAAVNRTVEANSFILRDNSGKERAIWGIEDNTGSPVLVFFNANGKMGMQLMVDKYDSPQLALYNSPESIELSIPSELKSQPPFKQVGGLMAQLAFKRADDTQLTLKADRMGRLGLIMNGDVPGIEMEDKDGFQTVIGRTQTETTRTGETHQTSAASVILFGKDKKVLWKAP
jgi:hypothetical protein